MKEQEQKMKLPKLDDLFTIQEQRDYEKAEKVEEINISSIKDFPNHPFNDLIIDTSYDEKIQEAVRNILSYFSNENGKLILKKNGYFKHGIIQGNVNKETSEYIGVNARKRQKKCCTAG